MWTKMLETEQKEDRRKWVENDEKKSGFEKKRKGEERVPVKNFFHTFQVTIPII